MHTNKIVAQLTPQEFNQFTKYMDEKRAAIVVMEAAMDHSRKMVAKSGRDAAMWWHRMGAKYKFVNDSTCNINPTDMTICKIIEDPAITEAESLINSDPDEVGAEDSQ